jgi:ABC-2 type transport system permease protein
VVRYAFRLHRWGMLGYAIVVFISAYFSGAAFVQIAGTTARSRASFAQQMTVIGQQYAYLVPLPHEAGTVAGYILWKGWGAFPIFLAVWAIASASGAVRGDEDKLLVDAWIAARVSRTRIAVSRFFAFAAAAAVVGLAAAAGSLVGALSVESLALDRLAGQTLVLWLLALDLFAICFLVAQLPGSKRGAQALAAVVLLVLFLLDSAFRTNASLDAPAWISPFRWFDASYPLIPAGKLDWVAVAVAATAAAVTAAVAVVLFHLRDVGGPLLRLSRAQAPAAERAATPFLRRPVLRLLYRQRWMLALWTLAVIVLAVYMTSAGKQMIDSLLKVQDNPAMRAFLTRGAADVYTGWIAVFWFNLAQLLISGFAVHLVSAWASDDGEGVLAAELSRPRHRWVVVLERFTVALVGIAVMAAAGSIAATLAALNFGVALDAGSVVRATVLLVPFALVFSAVGAVASVWWPRASVGALGGLIFASYMIYDVGPLFQWPKWLIDASPFALYGTPFLTGVYWTGLLVMLALVLAGYAAATYLMQRRELTA